jgi:uncharacterized membrane protein YphA (DoxX/SURF4 family)
MTFNPFPDLLVYGIFAPTLLRVAVAIALAWAVSLQWRSRHELSRQRFPVVGHGAWILWTMLTVEALTLLGLLFGYYTQWAALLGALIALKFAVWGSRYPKFFPLSRVASFLIVVICLSLLLSGAGQFAYDLPL